MIKRIVVKKRRKLINKEIVFDNPKAERSFRYSLNNCECKAKWGYDDTTIYCDIRPVSLTVLKANLLKSGNYFDKTIEYLLDYLETRPREYIRFEYEKINLVKKIFVTLLVIFVLYINTIFATTTVYGKVQRFTVDNRVPTIAELRRCDVYLYDTTQGIYVGEVNLNNFGNYSLTFQEYGTFHLYQLIPDCNAELDLLYNFGSGYTQIIGGTQYEWNGTAIYNTFN